MVCGVLQGLVVVCNANTEFGYIVDPTKNVNCSDKYTIMPNSTTRDKLGQVGSLIKV